METIYKSYKGIQWDCKNEFVNNNETERDPRFYWKMKEKDWIVYSPYKEKWKKYTDKEFKRDFKTLKQIQDEN